MRGDEIECSVEIGQRRVRIDSPHDATNAEEFGRPAEKRLVIWVEPETVVAKDPAEIEKITGAAA